jgi:phosphoglycerate dehydrogenase-like enzyme
MRVTYIDPVWTLADGGTQAGEVAALESEIYGASIGLSLGIRRNGGFVTEGEDLFEHVAGSDALVLYRCQLTPALLRAAGPSCKVVARQGVGLDNLNVDLLRSAGVYGFHVPDYCGDEVSTHTVAMLLALERGVCIQDKLVKAARWNIHAGGVPRRTAWRRLGIVGFGRIGRATSRKLQPFYCSTAAYDPHVSPDLMASLGVRRRDTLPELLAESDAVVLHAALTPESRGMIDARALSHLPRGALLVNTARGQLVDAAAVLASLQDGQLGGFASDVFSPEDPNATADTLELLRRDDVLVTAHRGFLSQESELSLRRRVAEGIAHVLSSDTPPPFGRVA